MKKFSKYLMSAATVTALALSTGAFLKVYAAEAPASVVAGQPVDLTYAAEKALPSVVHIKYVQNSKTKTVEVQDDPWGGFFDPFGFFGNPGGGSRQQRVQTPKREATGSGVIISQDGYIVTNNHVVEGADELTVTLNDNREFSAKIIGTDKQTDLALIKVNAKDLPAITIANSDDLKVGEWVLAVGNPYNLNNTVTAGIVSAKSRGLGASANGIESFIQTDAAINPGNSGGPLFNMYGEVIGITTAKYSGTTNSGASIEGIGFAIPIDDVMGIISDLIDYGYVTGAYMGITVKDNDKEAAAQFGLPTDGAYVVDVTPGSSADKAGIQSKDLITAVDDHKIATRTDLTRALRNYKAGDTAQITVVRSGRELTLTITFDEKPHSTTVETAPQEDSSMPSEGDYNDWYEYFRRFFGG